MEEDELSNWPMRRAGMEEDFKSELRDALDKIQGLTPALVAMRRTISSATPMQGWRSGASYADRREARGGQPPAFNARIVGGVVLSSCLRGL